MADRHALIQAASAWQRPTTVQQSAHAIFLQTDDAPGSDRDSASLPGRQFVGAANIHNPKEILALLNLRSGTRDVTLVRKAFEARKGDGLAALRGAFSFAHWNEAERELTLARDCGRGMNLYFYRAGDLVLFSSHLPSLVSHCDVPRQLDEQVVASFLSHDAYQQRRTFFRNVERVPPRHGVTIGPGGISSRAYWTPQIQDGALYRRDEDYIARGRELLDQAVMRSVGDEPKFAVMASGGLDSCAIVSTLARTNRSPIPCYTIVPEETSAGSSPSGRYADERPHTEALARMYPELKFQYLAASALGSDDYSDISRFARTATPYKGASLSRFGNQFRARIAGDGYDVVLGGGAGNFGLTWHGADLFPYLAGKGRLLLLLREASATARQAKQSMARVLARELALPSLPAFLRQEIKRRLSGDPFSQFGNIPLRREIASAFDLESAWETDGFDPYFAWPSSSPTERARWLFDRPLLQHDNCPASPVDRDAELRNPLGDRDLLEFALNVPATLYRKNGVPRWFARQVLADRVPAWILAERRRGSLETPWFESLSARRAEIAAEVERMENSILASQLFDIPRLKRLASNWPKDATEVEARGSAYILSLEQAVHVFQFMRWATNDNS